MKGIPRSHIPEKLQNLTQLKHFQKTKVKKKPEAFFKHGLTEQLSSKMFT